MILHYLFINYDLVLLLDGEDFKDFDIRNLDVFHFDKKRRRERGGKRNSDNIPFYLMILECRILDKECLNFQNFRNI